MVKTTLIASSSARPNLTLVVSSVCNEATVTVVHIKIRTTPLNAPRMQNAKLTTRDSVRRSKRSGRNLLSHCGAKARLHSSLSRLRFRRDSTMPDAQGKYNLADFVSDLQQRGFDGFAVEELRRLVNRAYFAVAKKS